MRAEWFEPMVRSWSAQVRWEPPELAQAAKLLMELSRAHGGAIAEDEALSEEEARAFALRRAVEVLQRRVNHYARAVEEGAARPRFSAASRESGSRGPALPFVTPCQWKEALDVNEASAEELEALPVLGRVLAARIVDHRREHGPFRAVEELVRVEGLGAQGVEQLRARVTVGGPRPVFRSEALEAFVREPSFERYVQWMARGEGSFLWRLGQGGGPAKQVLVELEDCLRDVREHPYGVARRLGFTRASAVRAERERRERAHLLDESTTGPARAGVLLRHGAYPEFVAKVLAGAEDSVRLVLFFFRYVDARYPTQALLQQLIAAHERGVDVQVILDRDAEGDVYNSRLINLPAYQALKAKQVPVRYDTVARLTHSKGLLVDGRHLVMGSHNWTLSAFTRYDETSVYLDSEELGTRFEARFQALWKDAARGESTRSRAADAPEATLHPG